MSVPGGFYPREHVIHDLADLTTPPARFRSTKHLTIPRAVTSQGWSTGMKPYRGKGAHELRKAAHELHPRIWRYVKSKRPTNTGKLISRDLDGAVSPRTVDGWQNHWPRTEHFLLMVFKWPDFFTYVTAQEISENQSRHQRLERALEELRHELNNAISTRDLWTKPEDSGGD